MRIITGKFKGANLFSVDGKTTRPTTDYNRELIFSVHSEYSELLVLDLFAGTGAFGLEALSRRASYVDFVEFSSKAIGVLLKNINKLRCGEQCHIHRRRVEQYLKDCPKKYDVIFLDPPYDKDLINPTLKTIFERELLNTDGIVIVEHSRREPVNEEFADKIIKTKAGKITSFTLLCA
ncbi:MAG: 16S rRNA (guanine(966)-N(2))-methyltransferase RsmD [Candidatus Cloacimonadaceae bacterium]|nr:16S rRNA (guanine(966)-N(2))-methyltransferase RsmD [Candidatus Cloacimonadaceae bacterium]